MSETLADWLARLEKRHPVSIDLGLDRCTQVFAAMGRPRPAPLIVTVAGTNGKGSVVAYLSSLLHSFGMSCGTYTSPHILEFNERVRINGVAARDRALVAAFEATEAARGDVSLTYFEFTTLAAFHLMHGAGLDAAVLEVGLGGRLDTVNLVDADCCVITPIGIDHQQYLGTDRESIGAEKAGILRPGVPVVCSDRAAPASVLGRAGELDAALYLLGRDFDWVLDGERCLLRCDGGEYPMPAPPMPGVHQFDNLAASMVAAGLVVPGFFGGQARWASAIANARLPGRLAMAAGDRRVVLDVGHNPLAAQVVAEHFRNAKPGAAQLHCVLGMLRDKDAEEAAGVLAGVVDRWYCAGLKGPRGQDGEELAARLKAVLPEADVHSFTTVGAALEAARSAATRVDRILVFGSFETVAEATRALD